MGGQVRGGVVIVGPCAAGKSTLAEGLQALGWRARQIAQEHSYVADMWQVLSQPDVLIYVQASFETCSERKRLNWSKAEYEEQLRRLEHARENCDLHLESDQASPAELVEQAAEFLRARRANGDPV